MFCISLFNVLEHERMIAKFPQLHDGVHQGLGVALVRVLRGVRQHDSFLLHVTRKDEIINLKFLNTDILLISTPTVSLLIRVIKGNGKVLRSTIWYSIKCHISDNSRVKSSLKSRHFALDDVLDLVRQLRLDVLLQTSQQKGSKNFVQTTDDQNRFFLVQLNLFASDSERGVEPLLEGVAGTKDRRQKKVKQRPEFRKFVLQRRSGE